MIRSILTLTLVAACASTGPTPSTTGTVEVEEVPDIASLTTEWGCGHGFWVTNDDQTAALHIAYVGQGQPQGETNLAHPDWEAEVIVGTDLHANWCDDVIEKHEPVPLERSTLEVVEGSLQLVGEVPEDFTGGQLTLEASDLVVALPDGGHSDFGSITITNPAWGTFAG